MTQRLYRYRDLKMTCSLDDRIYSTHIVHPLYREPSSLHQSDHLAFCPCHAVVEGQQLHAGRTNKPRTVRTQQHLTQQQGRGFGRVWSSEHRSPNILQDRDDLVIGPIVQDVPNEICRLALRDLGLFQGRCQKVAGHEG